MRKKGYILIISILLFQFAHAQVSGYMGKKWLLIYDFHTFPCFTYPNQNGKTGYQYLNLKHTFSLEYALARHLAVGTGVSLFKTDYNFTDISYFYSNDNSVYYNYTPSNIGSMNVTAYDFYLKIFLHKNLAPLGSYIKLQADYYNTNWSMDVSKGGGKPPLTPFPSTGSSKSTGVSVSFGRQYIYWDHLVLNSSFQIGFVFKGSSTKAQYTTPAEFMNVVTTSRLFYHDLFNLNIGIGYLIF